MHFFPTIVSFIPNSFSEFERESKSESNKQLLEFESARSLAVFLATCDTFATLFLEPRGLPFFLIQPTAVAEFKLASSNPR